MRKGPPRRGRAGRGGGHSSEPAAGEAGDVFPSSGTGRLLLAVGAWTATDREEWCLGQSELRAVSSPWTTGAWGSLIQSEKPAL